MHHALLFVGGDYQSKLKEANRIAEELLCTTGSQALWKAGTHPDYFLITPLEESRTIKIDQIRDLSASLAQKPQHAEYQVVIVALAEEMNLAAANALLKTLEEPAAHVKIILISEQLSRILPTVRSRCQIKRFPFIDNEFKSRELQEQYQYILNMLNQRHLNIVEAANELAKQNLSENLKIFYRVLADKIKNQTAEIQQRYFYFLDNIIEAKRLADTNIALNAQMLWEKLLLQYSAALL